LNASETNGETIHFRIESITANIIKLLSLILLPTKPCSRSRGPDIESYRTASKNLLNNTDVGLTLGWFITVIGESSRKNGLLKEPNVNRTGYTLLELMITVAIMGILASIAVGTYADVARKAYEARTKVNLGVIRSSLAIYFGETEGQSPLDNLACLVPKYLAAMPNKFTPPFHPDGNEVSAGDDADMVTSRGDWFYFNTQASPLFGKVVVNCVHSDLRGVVWSSY
jgi:prepilin-type N-terminal cleavage/methylation domain-containing protein